MALLTADDVLDKKFQATKFREGYDQDEVDDFLDEVVTTLRAVQTENDELKDKLAAAERRVAELTRAGRPTDDAADGAPAHPIPADDASPVVGTSASSCRSRPPGGRDGGRRVRAVRRGGGRRRRCDRTRDRTRDRAGRRARDRARRHVPRGQVNESASATGMLQLAQKLHDDHVR